ncbi:hypothetical protein ABSL23_17355 (plasmid) [Halobacterium sp. NMX12-1]|uniref:Uncharacterized protein n=1 Tax=Halobacterium sp. NMX12-1 TaxID=3166650 RepID=A0AAU8CHM3_9EURY
MRYLLFDVVTPGFASPKTAVQKERAAGIRLERQVVELLVDVLHLIFQLLDARDARVELIGAEGRADFDTSIVTAS